MSGLKGRRISADMFAIMLKISAGQLVFAAQHDKPLRGLTLPLLQNRRRKKLELDHLNAEHDV